MTQIQTTRKFDPNTATREQLVDRVCKLEKFIVTLKGQLGIALDIVADFYWLEQLIGNKSYSGNEKTILYGTRKAAAKREAREDGYVQVYREDIAEAAGVSPQTVGSTLKKLAEHNIVARKIEPARDKDTGQVTKNLLIQLPQKFDPSAPMELKEDESGWGGKRVKMCPTCHGTDLLEKHFYVCMNPECGCTIALDDVLEVSEEAMANDAALQRELEYPEVPRQELAARDVHAPTYACFECKTANWLPALKGDQWGYLCGTCRPFLASSQGRDLRKREGINE